MNLDRKNRKEKMKKQKEYFQSLGSVLGIFFFLLLMVELTALVGEQKKVTAAEIFFEGDTVIKVLPEEQKQETEKEKEQAAMPEAFPKTTKDAIKTVSNGDKILLTTTTQGAEIYYTTNGTEPLMKEDYRYQAAITVSGVYGGNYIIKAFAAGEGLISSETVTFIYQLAERKVLEPVIAVPGTERKVIAGDKILLSGSPTGGEIFYTLNGSIPEVTEVGDGTYSMGKSTFKYDPQKGVVVPEGGDIFCISAIAVAYGMDSSPVAQFVYTYEEGAVTPYSDPAPGAVAQGTEVLLKSDQEGAIIYYETAYGGEEPPEPTKSSQVFTEDAPLVIRQDTVIRAFAYSNRQVSDTVRLVFQAVKQAEAPVSPVDSSAVVSSGTTVTLPGGEGRVFYTTDGSDPMDAENKAVNTGNHVVIVGTPGEVVTVRACIRDEAGRRGAEAVYTYQISQYPGGVSGDLVSGKKVEAGTKLRLSTDVTNGVIYYTMDASAHPAIEGMQGDIVTLEGLPGSKISIRAVAVVPGTIMTGGYASFDYQLMEQLEKPTASVRDGTMLTEETGVELQAKEGTIYFTTDGSVPTEESWEYTAPILVSEEMILRAVVMADGFVDSEIVSFHYYFADQAQKPTTSAASGVVEQGRRISLSSHTEDALIYYTTDGSYPDPKATEGVFLYDGEEGIRIQRSVTIKAVAVKEGLSLSDLLTLHYQVEQIPKEIQREKTQNREAQEGLIPLDTEGLAARRGETKMGLSKKAVTVTDMLHRIILKGEEGVISQDTSLSAKQISISGETGEELAKKLGKQYKVLEHYFLTLYENGERVQPEGMVEIGLPIPEQYREADILLARISENGQVSLLETRRDNTYAYAKVETLGSCAVIGAVWEEPAEAGWNLSYLLLLAAGVLTIAGGIWILLILIQGKEKKQAIKTDK